MIQFLIFLHKSGPPDFMSSAPVRGISNPTVLLELLKVLAPRFLTSFYLPTPTITLATVLLQNSVPFV